MVKKKPKKSLVEFLLIDMGMIETLIALMVLLTTIWIFARYQ